MSPFLALSNFIASAYSGIRGRKYTSVTANPAMVAYRAKSPLWKMIRKPSNTFNQVLTKRRKTKDKNINSLRSGLCTNRVTASFRYVGPRNPDAAKKLGIV